MECIEAQGLANRGVGPVRSAKRYVMLRDGSRCRLCRGSGWQGKPMPLVLDHIDGNSANWSLTNLSLVCPNCDGQLPTFKNRNRGNGRAKRRQRYTDGLSY
jgi:hypothetical protein